MDKSFGNNTFVLFCKYLIRYYFPLISIAGNNDINSENELPSKCQWNNRISLPNGAFTSKTDYKNNQDAIKNRKYQSLHGVQTFHRRQHLKPNNAAGNRNRRKSFENIRRPSRVSEKDLVSILEQTLGNKISIKANIKSSNRVSDEPTNINNQVQSKYKYDQLINLCIFKLIILYNLSH